MLAYTKGITVKLQQRSIDAKAAYDSLSDVIGVIKNLRSNVESKHVDWFKKAAALASTLDVPVSKPRTTGRQRHRNNVPAETDEVYYRRSVTAPFLVFILSEMHSRFQEGQQTTFRGFSGCFIYIGLDLTIIDRGNIF